MSDPSVEAARKALKPFGDASPFYPRSLATAAVAGGNLRHTPKQGPPSGCARTVVPQKDIPVDG